MRQSYVRSMARLARLLAVLPVIGFAEATPTEQASRAAASAVAAERLPGYLAPHERPDSTRLVPPPPAEDSAAHAAEVEAYRALHRLRNSQRWRHAATDANVQFPHAAGAFACALGVRIASDTTPRLYTLLRRTVIDAGQSTYAAKVKYARPRPFTLFDDPVCVPEDLKVLRANGAYPSGHASLGWTWALILTSIAPERMDALLGRGIAFGESRMICGVHWVSDVTTGRDVGAAVHARLQSNAEFQADLAAARAEVAHARQAGHAPTGDCAVEAAILGLDYPQVQPPSTE